MVGERIRLAREASGLTQQELAAAAGVSQSVLSSTEAGRVLSPSTENVGAIAAALGFPAAFFSLGPLPDIPEGNYRRLARGASKVQKQLRAQARQIVEVVQRCEPILRLPAVAIEPLAAHDGPRDLEAIALRARVALGVGNQDPIPNLMRAVERAGVVVVRLPLELDAHDGFSTWPDLGLGGRPLIVLTGGHPGDRDRFSLAHELGHLVLHSTQQGIDPKQAETEAHRFAGALLLPAKAARRAMRPPVTLRVLMGVKANYGISIAAAAMRALDLNLIGRPHFTSIHKQLSARGWKKEEPVDVPIEQPTLLPRMLHRLGGTGSAVERAERVGMPVFAYNALSSPG